MASSTCLDFPLFLLSYFYLLSAMFPLNLWGPLTRCRFFSSCGSHAALNQPFTSFTSSPECSCLAPLTNGAVLSPTIFLHLQLQRLSTEPALQSHVFPFFFQVYFPSSNSPLVSLGWMPPNIFRYMHC